MSNELVVPKPEIDAGEYLNPNSFLKKREAPLIFTLGRVLKRDGNALLISEVSKACCHIYQENNAGMVMLWDKKKKQWKPSSEVGRENRELIPLEYVAEDANNPWKGTIILIGEKGKFKNTDNTGYPRYFIKCFFEQKLSGNIFHDGLSENSESIKLHEWGINIKAGLYMDDTDSPTVIKYFIKNGSGLETAKVELNNNGEITIKNNHNNAEVIIHSNGNITINGNVAISGSLHVRGHRIY